MTNKTEDRFYFGKHGQPKRFAEGHEDEMASGPFTKQQDARLAKREEQLRKQRAKKALEDYKTAVREEDRYAGSVFVTPRRMDELQARTQAAYEEAKRLNPDYKGFSRPGKPDEFDLEEACWDGYEPVGTKRKDGQTVPNCVPMKNEKPEKFDASSLDRKGFAAASSSPMLGKLLSEKQMPEGGWRAVETGGGALVISFEDGDVAGNFARRVASNGYSATAPVQSIGRYWNVEVKNGK